MYNEEDFDPHIPTSGSENGPSDDMRRAWPPATYPNASAQSTPAFLHPTSLPPSVQEAWVAYQHGTPMQTALSYVENPLDTQLFPPASASTLPQHGGTVSGPPPHLLAPMSANYFETYGVATLAPAPAPTTPLHQPNYSPSTYG